MRYIFSIVLFFLYVGAGAQKIAPRTEFISYNIREDAQQGSDKNPYYMVLNMNKTENRLATKVDIPYVWLDRDLFVQVEGVGSYTLVINGHSLGRGEDSHTPTQFIISDFVADGRNEVVLNLERSEGEGLDRKNSSTTPKITLFSQPKVRVESFRISFAPDSTAKHGTLDLEIALANSYNFPETIVVGYDIYAPNGELQYYDFREITVSGQGRDTMRFMQPIWRTNNNMWSADSPLLYYGMITLKRDTRMEEYIPYRVGFGTTQITGREILRNGKPININAVRYNASSEQKVVLEHIKGIKERGINTLMTDYPQPKWFYDLCDEWGMYVIDQASINSDHQTDNRKVGGALSNDPKWKEKFLARTKAMYERVNNHSCIIGWSLGGSVGNGYNMYHTYRWLKSVEPHRAVVFNDVQGEWNSDMEIESQKTVVVHSAPTPSRGQKR